MMAKRIGRQTGKKCRRFESPLKLAELIAAQPDLIRKNRTQQSARLLLVFIIPGSTKA